MGYGSDDRDNRWRDREGSRGGERGWGDRDRDREGGGGDRWNEGGRERSGWGGGPGRGPGGDGDRGFFERAGEEVRSWFGSDDDDRRDRGDRGYGRGGGREDGRRREQERGSGGRGGQDHEGGSYGWMSGGWGNQAGESWNRDRPGVREEGEDREGWFSASQGGERGNRWGGSEGRGGDRDPTGFGGLIGASGYGGSGSYRGGGESQVPIDHRGLHDPHYSEWRRRQIEDLDRDYDEYRREHQSKFEQEFGNWRSKRQSQRQMLGSVREQMEVVGSDGSPVGTVEKVTGDRIVLARAEADSGGMNQSVPCGWIDRVEGGKVILSRTADHARSEWREEEGSRALFERREQGSEGPHVLNRSFSGTYKDDDKG
jgi:hypothetical protein